MARQSTEVTVGAIVFVVSTVFLSYAFTGGGFVQPSGYEIEARFAQVDGLRRGSPVRLSGIEVGEVTGLRYDHKTRQAVITMKIADGVPLPTDSAAMIVQVGLLGDKFIKLDPGGAEEMVGPGGVLEIVQDSVLVLDLLEKVLADVEAKRKKRRAKSK